MRWWVQGDQLCNTRYECGGVLVDVRFPHLVRGNSKRLRVTVVAAPLDTRIGEVGGREHAGATDQLR
jgi:hypothetical protein